MTRVYLPAILKRDNLVQVSVQTVYSYSKLEEAMNAARDRGRVALVGSDGKLYAFRPEHAKILAGDNADD